MDYNVHMNESYGYDTVKYNALMEQVFAANRAGKFTTLADLVHEEDYETIKHFPMGATPHFMAEKDIQHLITKKKFPLVGKRVLDIGTGTGAFMKTLAENCDADVIGFEQGMMQGNPGVPYKLQFENNASGTIYVSPVEGMPENLWNTFDIAINYRAQDMSKYGIKELTFDTSTEACARALKEHGIYVGTLIDGQFQFKGGRIIKNQHGREIVESLEKHFTHLEIDKAIHGPKDRTALFIAEGPRR